MKLVDNLRWRGMVQDIMPGTEEQLEKEMTTAYVGIDPTADSLHIGHLVGVMMLKHLQESGHRPIVLIGGATGMIGDPSGKSLERNLLDAEAIKRNMECIKTQLKKFLDFDSDAPNAAIMVNNYDWMKDYSFLSFIRDIGKHITVNYMMTKDSVKKRIAGEDREGMSFTEFSYQLVQGTDFLELYQKYNCKLQMGGSDQWGNITTGSELIRRKLGKEAYALTCPLITKADGGKFGKTESGNIWLDAKKTSPYKFYQFWLNCSDADAEKYIKIFTLFSKDYIEELIIKHNEAPHLRLLQKELAKDLTIRVHSQEDYDNALEASAILFGNSTTDSLRHIPVDMLMAVFEGVPQADVSREVLKNGVSVVDLMSEITGFFPSKGEIRRSLKENAISINKAKVNDTCMLNEADIIGDKLILAQKGKKNYYLVIITD
ncbi:MAG: tyrosine--tRNA ligase [Bacteroidales bacterium]|nr:tyrosine--tRNA ligase [Bacteroidales bacterium]MDD2205498.1 tyrosine--tRNA ligase [Bacteroidales bacterium]MDD3151570.1 tyrosine--tRNA ligase [Bacteroidales bacterium]MDD3914935.1 tyrosine--tRNA ligase [Bacteroidales bacterium]MDD4634787.1 tyrosine--tRNA ligase [Bacteroidales bacterium]